MAKVILAATTSSGFSSQFFISRSGGNKTVCATGLAGAEVVTIQFLDGNGTWVNMASNYNLTATDPVRTIFGEGEYRLSKPSTAGATSLSVSG